MAYENYPTPAGSKKSKNHNGSFFPHPNFYQHISPELQVTENDLLNISQNRISDDAVVPNNNYRLDKEYGDIQDVQYAREEHREAAQQNHYSSSSSSPVGNNTASSLQLTNDAQYERERHREATQQIDYSSSPPVSHTVASSLQLSNAFQDNKEQFNHVGISASLYDNSSSYMACNPLSHYSPPLLAPHSNTSSEFSCNNYNGGVRMKTPNCSINSTPNISPLQDYQRIESNYISPNSFGQVDNGSIGYSPNVSNIIPSSANKVSSSNLTTQSQTFNSILSGKALERQNVNNSYQLHLIDELDKIVIRTCAHNNREEFCFDCVTELCKICRNSHRTHTLFSLSQTPEILDSILQNKLKSLKIDNLQDKLNCSFRKTTTVLDQLDKTAEIVKNKIRKREANIKEQLEYQKDKLFVDLNTIYYRKINNLDQQLQNLSINHLDASPCETEDLFYEPLNEATCTEIINNFGSVHSSADISRIKTSGIGLNMVIINNYCGFTVQCFDHMNQEACEGDDDVGGILICPSGRKIHIKMTDLKNSFYQGILNTSERGKHHLYLTLRGILIPNGKYELNCKHFTDLWSFDNLIPNQINKSEFNILRGLHCDVDGRIYITDIYKNCVLIFDHLFNFVSKLGCFGNENGQFKQPNGVTVDKSKRIIVADTLNHRIQVFSYDGKFLFSFGSLGTDKGQFEEPVNVATNSKCHIAVTDFKNNRVQLFNANGEFIAITKNFSSTKKLINPCGIHFEEDDTILVTNSCERANILRYQVSEYSLQGILSLDEKFSIGFDSVSFAEVCGLTMSKESIIFSGVFKGSFYIHIQNLKTEKEKIYKGEDNTKIWDVTLSPLGQLYAIVTNSFGSRVIIF